jgi:hypothetical protein
VVEEMGGDPRPVDQQMAQLPVEVREGTHHLLETVDVSLETLALAVDFDVIRHELLQPLERVLVAAAVVAQVERLELS